ncbi:MAG: SO_0444 family Cu/Zn efflux transporter [Desulfurivibrionaceae bacterium]
MDLISSIFVESWQLLLDAAPYILFGIVIGGLLKVFLSPAYVARHLGQGRFSSVFKAALFGVPLPLCSCGVLPAAATLKKQGANNGATAAFLISTPESGIDSIAVTYALLDPIMTVARPLAAFLTALAAGLTENLLRPPKPRLVMADFSCVVDGCCDGIDCPPEIHAAHHSLGGKLLAGMRYAFGELWGDLAGWFFFGLLLAGGISALVPETLITGYLSGGLGSMLLMLAFGIPLYICATASTPIAAALILKGVSPGAALVFLLAGPATNMATLTVLANLLGKRTTLVYLAAIGAGAVLCGLAVDGVYALLGIQAKGVVGQAAEIMPYPVQLGAALLLLALSVKPISAMVRGWFKKETAGCCCDGDCEIKAESHSHEENQE